MSRCEAPYDDMDMMEFSCLYHVIRSMSDIGEIYQQTQEETILMWYQYGERYVGLI